MITLTIQPHGVPYALPKIPMPSGKVPYMPLSDITFAIKWAARRRADLPPTLEASQQRLATAVPELFVLNALRANLKAHYGA